MYRNSRQLTKCKPLGMVKQNAEFASMCVNTSHHPCRLRLNKCMISTHSADSSMAAPGIMASTALYSEPANRSLLSWIWSPKVYKFPMPIFCPRFWCFFFKWWLYSKYVKTETNHHASRLLAICPSLGIQKDWWSEWFLRWRKDHKDLEGFFWLTQS